VDFLRMTQEQQWKQTMERINRLRGVSVYPGPGTTHHAPYVPMMRH
jgi:hypothetical protein